MADAPRYFTAQRFFRMYGPRGRPDMMTYRLLDAIRTGKPMLPFNGGYMHRAWTFIGDVVSGVFAAPTNAATAK